MKQVKYTEEEIKKLIKDLKEQFKEQQSEFKDIINSMLYYSKLANTLNDRIKNIEDQITRLEEAEEEDEE